VRVCPMRPAACNHISAREITTGEDTTRPGPIPPRALEVECRPPWQRHGHRLGVRGGAARASGPRLAQGLGRCRRGRRRVCRLRGRVLRMGILLVGEPPEQADGAGLRSAAEEDHPSAGPYVCRLGGKRQVAPSSLALMYRRRRRTLPCPTGALRTKAAGVSSQELPDTRSSVPAGSPVWESLGTIRTIKGLPVRSHDFTRDPSRGFHWPSSKPRPRCPCR
jgi:hypothetical protein